MALTRNEVVNIGGNWISNNGNLPERVEKDVYQTPRLEVEQAYDFLLQAAPEYRTIPPLQILDVGAGSGVWGQVAHSLWPEALITGVEIRTLARPDGYNVWHRGDFREYSVTHAGYDLIVGNPPFYMDGACVERSMEMLRPGGHLLFLLKLAFITGQKRLETIYQPHGLKAFGVYTHRIRWHSAEKDLGPSPPRDHGLYLWKKGDKGRCQVYLVGNEEQGLVTL